MVRFFPKVKNLVDRAKNILTPFPEEGLDALEKKKKKKRKKRKKKGPEYNIKLHPEVRLFLKH